jgi:hypothetical protein
MPTDPKHVRQAMTTILKEELDLDIHAAQKVTEHLLVAMCCSKDIVRSYKRIDLDRSQREEREKLLRVIAALNG